MTYMAGTTNVYIVNNTHDLYDLILHDDKKYLLLFASDERHFFNVIKL